MKTTILAAALLFSCGPAAAGPPGSGKTPEMRGVWMHATQIKTPEEADRWVKRIEEAHLNAVFLLVWYWGGQAFFESSLCPMGEGVEKGYDPLGYMVSRCHERDIEVHAWFVNGAYGASKPGHVLDAHPDWAVDSDTTELWYDFGKPAVRKFESDLMIECLRRYDIDGVHFDYIRYGPTECRCKHCREKFARLYGRPREEARQKDWLEFRARGVTALVRDVYRRAKKLEPGCLVSAAVFTPLASARRVCQDWPGWLQEGIIDLCIPMAYTHDNKLLAEQIREWKTVDPNLHRIVPGLSIYKRTTAGTVTRQTDFVLAQHDLCMRAGARGNVYFSLHYLTPELAAAVRKGPYAHQAAAYHPPARSGAGSGQSASRLDAFRKERKRLAHRRRRIIFNNDGNEPVYYLDEATPEAFLACRTTPLLGSHVDSIFYCTWSSGFSYFTHNTKIGQVFDITDNPKHPDNKIGGFSKNKTAEFIRQGTDVLEILVDFCKKHDIEIFWSFRMNDTHDAWGSWYGDYLFPRLKKEHPEWLVGGKKKRPRHGGWSAMNFAVPQVRDLAVAFIEEVCRNYDVDGIEMDFFRHPLYFKNPASGKDATPEDRELMTGMLRRVREVTEREGLRRGRPILVAVRVPDSTAYAAAMGLDIVRWLEEDLVDLMAVSGYFRLSPWKTSIDLGHRYGVPVYPCLSETRLRDGEARAVRASPACYRARAANAWDAGADGVYLFNSFNPRSPLWRELGDPRTLEKLEKVYVTGARGVAAINSWMEQGERRFLRRQVLSPERPVKLAAETPAAVDLRVAEVSSASSGKSPPVQVSLRLRATNLSGPQDLVVKINGTLLEGGRKSGVYLEYPVDPRLLKRGANRFTVTLKPVALKPARGPAPVLQDLQLRVQPSA